MRRGNSITRVTFNMAMILAFTLCLTFSPDANAQADYDPASMSAMDAGHFVVTEKESAQQGTGNIEGRVYDKENKQGLPGATVLIKGTSIGASTDLNGEFILRNAPSGEQAVVISYIGYNSATEVVDVPENQTLKKDFFLSATAVQGKAVVVTAQAEGQMQAINQQLSSDKIVNVVSEAKIQALPETNAASAIGKLPGVSVQRSNGEASEITVRGIQPQYNEVAISNVPLASEGGNRAVDLSMITPYMLKSIQVYKTLTPDMDADAIGGYVNMELREAPSGFHSDLMWQSGYVQKNNTYGNYKAVASASSRFLDDALGIYGLVNAENYGANADNMGASYNVVSSAIGANGYEPVQVSTVSLVRHAEMRQRYGANLILDWKLPSGTLTSTNMFSRFNSQGQDYTESLNYSSKSLGFNFMSHNSNQDLALNTIDWANDFELFSMNLEVANTYSLNKNPDSPNFNFSQTGGIVGVAPVNTPPEDLLSQINYVPNGGAADTYLNTMGLTSSVYRENDQQYNADFRIPLSVSSLASGYFKLGGMFRYNYRDNAQDNPGANPVAGLVDNTTMVQMIAKKFDINYDSTTGEFPGTYFTSTDSKLYASFLSNKFGGMYWVPNGAMLTEIANYINATYPKNPEGWSGTTNGGWANGPAEWDNSKWKYIERYYAGYLMANLNVGPRLDVVGGARYEADYSYYAVFNLPISNNPEVQPVYPVSAHRRNMFLLPMVQGKYEINDWSDLRAGYSQTIARPAYQETSPEYYTQYGTYAAGGNPNLRPPKSYNEDIELDFHGNGLGLLAIDAFYKTVAHFDYGAFYELYQTLPPDLVAAGFDTLGQFKTPGLAPGTNFNTWINSPYNAYIKGISVSYETRLWYLPAPINGVVLGINYSHMSSTAQYPVIGTKIIPNPNNPRRGTATLLDSSRTSRLIDQPNDILNAYIGYEVGGFSARVSLQFQGSALDYVGTYPSQDGFTKDYYRIDAQVTQQLPWKGFQLYLDGENLNSAPNISAENAIGGFTSEQYYGFTTYLGLRYTL